jgi:serine/threonine-protein kinase RsbW
MLPPIDHPWTWSLSQSLPSDVDIAHHTIDRLESALSEAHWEGRELFHVRMAVEESLVNAIEHGNKRDPNKTVSFEARLSPDACWIQITDQGAGFCRAELKSCLDEDHLDQPRGRGVWLIEQLMSDVHYNERGNQITLFRKRHDPRLAEPTEE